MEKHNLIMTKCIELAKEAKLDGNSPVGSIVLLNDKIVGIGKEGVHSKKDITRHAEIEAIQSALENVKSLRGSTLYTTHEPCVMCSYVIRHYQIGTIVFGLRSKHIGGKSSEFNLLETESVPNWKKKPSIIEGIMENECLQLSKIS